MKTADGSVPEYSTTRDEFIRRQQENMRWMHRCIFVTIATVVALGVVASVSLLVSCMG